MREIKFRVWHNRRMLPGHKSCWLRIDGSQLEINGFRFHRNDPLPTLMQFTGLHDKNGKEIYEGDILELYCAGAEPENRSGAVIYDTSLARHVIFPEGIGIGGDPQDRFVIGNIYENPELLENKS